MRRGQRDLRRGRIVVIGRRRGPRFDYLISNDDEWNEVFGLGAATLSGKTIGLSGEVSARTLSSFNPSSTVTLVGTGSGLMPQITLANVSNFTFRNVLFQHKAWPYASSGIIWFSAGTFDNLVFDGCTFRHGYGPSNVDFDPTASYPEYNRVDNVTNATTTSTRIPLTFQDPAATSAWVEFFNRGTQNVWYRIGDSSVVATASDTLAVPGTASARSATFNPQTSTHIAILSASGTQEVNARTEIGMSEYMAQAFVSSGGLTFGNITLRGCMFTDLYCAVKGISKQTNGSVFIAIDNQTRRVYADQLAIGAAPGVTYYLLRNILEIPVCRSGIAEALNGDARDPHGDLIQFTGDDTGVVGPIYSAGNITRMPARRTGAGGAQGMFVSDNDFDPSYDRVFSISDALAGGSQRGINIGEAALGYFSRRAMVFGATVFDYSNLSNFNAGIKTHASTDAENAVLESYVTDITTDSGSTPAIESGNVLSSAVASPSACLPNWSSRLTASTRSELESVFTTAAEALGKGAVAKKSAVDWSTSDHTQVIKWDQVPSGAAWSSVADQPLNTLVAFPLRRILNERANQAVEPIAGAAWRSVDTDKTTEVQAWTTSSGTIQPNQYIQWRATSSASNNTTTNPGVRINGFDCTAGITTVAAFAARGAFFDGSSKFVNSSISGLTGSNQGMASLWLRFNGTWHTPSGAIGELRVGSTLVWSLTTTSSGRMTFRLNQDGTGSDTWVTPGSTFVGNTWYHILWSWSWSASRFQVYINNVAANTSAYAFTGATTFDFNGAGITQASMGGSTSTGNWPGDLGHVYINLAESLDLSVQANREKFALAGVPVNQGADGSLVTGNVPAFFWDGVPPTWNNKGSVASGTLTGSLTASSPPPSY